jgi:hypothetical protein
MTNELFPHDLHNFVNEFTGMSDSVWDNPEADCKGLYPFRALPADKTRFLELIREYCRDHPRCDPIDGQTHDLTEIADWIWRTEASPTSHELALKFISLGIGLGLFELEPDTWNALTRQSKKIGERGALGWWVRDRILAGEACRFRFRDDANAG